MHLFDFEGENVVLTSDVCWYKQQIVILKSIVIKHRFHRCTFVSIYCSDLSRYLPTSRSQSVDCLSLTSRQPAQCAETVVKVDNDQVSVYVEVLSGVLITGAHDEPTAVDPDHHRKLPAPIEVLHVIFELCSAILHLSKMRLNG